MSKIDLHPKICNLCGGPVIYTDNSIIYGRPYGSGKMYFCTKCGAYVGTHEPRPTEAFGILANREMRDLKTKCHALFDEKLRKERSYIKRRQKRQECYRTLAEQLCIPKEECHFGYFDLNTLKQVYQLLLHDKSV